MTSPLNPREVNELHRMSDKDHSRDSQHHTLGPLPYQSSPGDHSHDGVTSKFIARDYVTLTDNQNVSGNKTWSGTLNYLFNATAQIFGYADGNRAALSLRNLTNPGVATHILGRLFGTGYDNSGTLQNYTEIRSVLGDPTSTNKNGYMDIFTMVNNVFARVARFGQDSTIGIRAVGYAVQGDTGVYDGSARVYSTNNPPPPSAPAAHNHTQSTITDTDTSASANTIAVRDSSADMHMRLLRPTYTFTTGNGNFFSVQHAVGAGADNYIRPATPSQAAGMLSGLVNPASHSHNYVLQTSLKAASATFSATGTVWTGTISWASSWASTPRTTAIGNHAGDAALHLTSVSTTSAAWRIYGASQTLSGTVYIMGTTET